MMEMSGLGVGDTLSSNMSTIMDEALNISCQELQVKGLPLPLSPTTANTIRFIQSAYYIASFVLGMSLNTFLISLMVCNKRLKTITYFHASQIIVLDIANAIAILPTSAVNALVGSFVFTGLCPLLGLLLVFLSICRTSLMAMLVVDRFCTVFMPFRYGKRRTIVVTATSVASWIIAMVVSLAPLPGLLDCYEFQRLVWLCTPGEGCNYTNACTAFRSFLTTSLLLGSVVAFLLYSALLIKAKQIRHKIEASESTMTNQSQDERDEVKQRGLRERRANTTFFFLSLALVGVILVPFIFTTIGNLALTSFSSKPSTPAYIIISIIARSVFALLVIFDPIVIMRNPEVREVIGAIRAKMRGRVKCDRTSTTQTTTLS